MISNWCAKAQRSGGHHHPSWTLIMLRLRAIPAGGIVITTTACGSRYGPRGRELAERPQPLAAAAPQASAKKHRAPGKCEGAVLIGARVGAVMPSPRAG